MRTIIQLCADRQIKASAEWWEFDNGYDTDFAILEQVGNEPVDPDYEYEAYCCYSPEMEERIDEICEKYGLSKLSGFRIVDDYNDLCSKAGIGDFCERASENVFFANITNEEWGEKIYIIADREKSFIVINVLGDMSSDITNVNDERLELLADAFNFAAIP